MYSSIRTLTPYTTLASPTLSASLASLAPCRPWLPCLTWTSLHAPYALLALCCVPCPVLGQQSWSCLRLTERQPWASRASLLCILSTPSFPRAVSSPSIFPSLALAWSLDAAALCHRTAQHSSTSPSLTRSVLLRSPACIHPSILPHLASQPANQPASAPPLSIIHPLQSSPAQPRTPLWPLNPSSSSPFQAPSLSSHRNITQLPTSPYTLHPHPTDPAIPDRTTPTRAAAEVAELTTMTESRSSDYFDLAHHPSSSHQSPSTSSTLRGRNTSISLDPSQPQSSAGSSSHFHSWPATPSQSAGPGLMFHNHQTDGGVSNHITFTHDLPTAPA